MRRRICTSLVTASASWRHTTTAVAAVQLRDALRLLPQRGGTLEELAVLHGQCIGEQVDPTSIRAALASIADAHVLVRDSVVVPVDWRKVLETVRAKLPPEGVLERSFVRLVASECPSFLASPLAAATASAAFRAWLARWFSDVIAVRTANTDASIFIFSAAAAPTQSVALDVVASAADSVAGARVTRWVDAAILRRTNAELLQDIEGQLLAPSDRLESDVRLAVRLKRDVLTCLVVVDACGALRPSDAETALATGPLRDVVRRGSRKRIVTLRRAGSSAPAALRQHSEVIVDAFLDPADVVCATLAADASNVQVVVCSDDAAANQCASALQRDCADHVARRRVVVCTPTGTQLVVVSA